MTGLAILQQLPMSMFFQHTAVDHMVSPRTNDVLTHGETFDESKTLNGLRSAPSDLIRDAVQLQLVVHLSVSACCLPLVPLGPLESRVPAPEFAGKGLLQSLARGPCSFARIVQRVLQG